MAISARLQTVTLAVMILAAALIMVRGMVTAGAKGIITAMGWMAMAAAMDHTAATMPFARETAEEMAIAMGLAEAMAKDSELGTVRRI